MIYCKYKEVHTMSIEDVGNNVRRYMKLRGLTIPKLSAEIKMGTATLSNLLNGKSEPRTSTLVKLSDALEVSLEELIADAPKLHSLRFRTAKTLSGREKSERDQLKHETAIWLSDYCSLEELLHETMPYPLERLSCSDPISAAMAVRKEIGLNKNAPVYDMTALMEGVGIKLNIRPFHLKKTFGLSIGNMDGGPGIVVNSERGLSVERQIFTIAHELGHLVLHSSSYAVSDDVEDKDEEKAANLFAGVFLVPDDALMREWEESKGLSFVDRVLKVKKYFKVSYLTVLQRISQLNDTVAYTDLIIKFRKDYKVQYKHDLKNHYEPDAISEDMVAEMDPNALDPSDLMEDRFSRLVRNAYEEGLISMSRAGEILHLPIRDMRALAASWKELC